MSFVSGDNELAAELPTLADQLRSLADQLGVPSDAARLREAADALDRLEQERDEARGKAQRNEDGFLKMLGASAVEFKRAEALEGEARRLKERAERAAKMLFDAAPVTADHIACPSLDGVGLVEIARRTLHGDRGDWLPYEETYYELAQGIIRLGETFADLDRSPVESASKPVPVPAPGLTEET